MGRVLALILFISANCFGQVATGNDKYEQKQYADAANAYEKVPPNQRSVEIYNRIGISYHLSNQLRAAETAYRNALKLQPDNAAVRNNLSALYYSQNKFSDAEREPPRHRKGSGKNAVMRLNLRAARYARENVKSARTIATGIARENATLIEKREGDLLQMQMLLPRKNSKKPACTNVVEIRSLCRKMYDDAVIEYRKSINLDHYMPPL